MNDAKPTPQVVAVMEKSGRSDRPTPLDFADSSFFIKDATGLKLKKVLVLDAADGDPESFPDDAIVLLRNYKKNLTRGKTDAFKHHDVIAIRSNRDVIYIPLDQAEKFSSYLYSLSASLKKKV